VFETSSRVFKELGAKPRGNTQAVLVAAGFSGEPRDFYLGVVHAEVNRAYQNFFYKMQVGAFRGGTCEAWQGTEKGWGSMVGGAGQQHHSCSRMQDMRCMPSLYVERAKH
jgi:hypothetical protein